MRYAKVIVEGTYFYMPGHKVSEFIHYMTGVQVIENPYSKAPTLKSAEPTLEWTDEISAEELSKREQTIIKEKDERSNWWLQERDRAETLQKEVAALKEKLLQKETYGGSDDAP